MNAFLPDLRGVHVVQAKATLAELGVNTLVHRPQGVPETPSGLVREQLPAPGSAISKDGLYHVILVVTKAPRQG